MVVDVTRIEDAVMPFGFEADAEKLGLDTPNYRVVGPVKIVDWQLSDIRRTT